MQVSPCCSALTTPYQEVRAADFNALIEQPWLRLADQICRIALGVFAGYLAPAAFAISAGTGLAVGVAYATASRMDQNWLFPLGEGRPICAQGYMDFLTGVRFPPLVGCLATAAFIAAHMRHDPLFYVPFCGVCIGFWLGRHCGINNRQA